MRFEVQITGVTVAIGDPRPADGLRPATIQLFDGNQPIEGAIVTRPLPAAVALRAQVGDRWTVSLQREVAL